MASHLVCAQLRVILSFERKGAESVLLLRLRRWDSPPPCICTKWPNKESSNSITLFLSWLEDTVTGQSTFSTRELHLGWICGSAPVIRVWALTMASRASSVGSAAVKEAVQKASMLSSTTKNPFYGTHTKRLLKQTNEKVFTCLVLCPLIPLDWGRSQEVKYSPQEKHLRSYSTTSLFGCWNASSKGELGSVSWDWGWWARVLLDDYSDRAQRKCSLSPWSFYSYVAPYCAHWFCSRSSHMERAAIPFRRRTTDKRSCCSPHSDFIYSLITGSQVAACRWW